MYPGDFRNRFIFGLQRLFLRARDVDNMSGAHSPTVNIIWLTHCGELAAALNDPVLGADHLEHIKSCLGDFVVDQCWPTTSARYSTPSNANTRPQDEPYISQIPISRETVDATLRHGRFGVANVQPQFTNFERVMAALRYVRFLISDF